jgi:hypothetical protein
MLLWTVTRCLEDGWHLSRVRFSDVWSDFTKLVTSTPVLSYRLHSIIQLQILEPLKIDVLNELHHLFFGLGQQSWMPMFLATFILLRMCDLTTAQTLGPSWKYTSMSLNIF